MILDTSSILKIFPSLRLQNERKGIIPQKKGNSFENYHSIDSFEKRNLVGNDKFAAFWGLFNYFLWNSAKSEKHITFKKA